MSTQKEGNKGNGERKKQVGGSEVMEGSGCYRLLWRLRVKDRVCVGTVWCF